jgi:ADP-ribose pyrophosphatase
MDALLPVVSYYPSPGACSEQIRLFVGRVRSAAVGEIKGVDTEHEDILVHSVSRADAIALLDAGKINNGLTIIALHWLARHGDRLRAQWLDR